LSLAFPGAASFAGCAKGALALPLPLALSLLCHPERVPVSGTTRDLHVFLPSPRPSHLVNVAQVFRPEAFPVGNACPPKGGRYIGNVKRRTSALAFASCRHSEARLVCRRISLLPLRAARQSLLFNCQRAFEPSPGGPESRAARLTCIETGPPHSNDSIISRVYSIVKHRWGYVIPTNQTTSSSAVLTGALGTRLRRRREPGTWCCFGGATLPHHPFLCRVSSQHLAIGLKCRRREPMRVPFAPTVLSSPS